MTDMAILFRFSSNWISSAGYIAGKVGKWVYAVEQTTPTDGFWTRISPEFDSVQEANDWLVSKYNKNVWEAEPSAVYIDSKLQQAYLM